MYCRECGQQIKEGDAFCGNCGTPIEIKDTTQSENKREGKNIIGRLSICLIVLLGIGVGGWFFFYKPNDDISEDTEKVEKPTYEIDETEETDESEESVEESGILSYAASEYLKALLDNSYKNDSSQLVSMKITTAEEAAEIYEEGLDAEVSEITTASGNLSDEQYEEYRKVFAEILAGAKYTIGDAEKQDDGSYVVTVIYEQMNVFEPAIEAYMEAVIAQNAEWQSAYENGGENPSDDEKMEWAVMVLKDCIKDSLKSVTYDEPQTTTVKLRMEGNVWTPSTSDLTKLEEVFFDLDDAYAVLQ